MFRSFFIKTTFQFKKEVIKFPHQEHLQDKYFILEEGGNIHTVSEKGYPIYYNKELKNWRVSSLAFIWGHKDQELAVQIIDTTKIDAEILNAPVDLELKY